MSHFQRLSYMVCNIDGNSKVDLVRDEVELHGGEMNVLVTRWSSMARVALLDQTAELSTGGGRSKIFPRSVTGSCPVAGAVAARADARRRRARRCGAGEIGAGGAGRLARRWAICSLDLVSCGRWTYRWAPRRAGGNNGGGTADGVVTRQTSRR